MDTPKGSLIIPKRFLGGLLKLLWNDVSFSYADSVDHTKVLQIAIKTCLGPSQTTHKRPQKTVRRRPATQMSPQETPKLTPRDNKWYPRDPNTSQGPPRRGPGDAWRAPRHPRSPIGYPRRAPKSLPKGSLEAYRSSSGKMYPLFTWILWTLRKYYK